MLDIKNISYRQFVELKRGAKKGRPSKYENEKERNEAHKLQQKIWHQKYDKMRYRSKKALKNKGKKYEN